LKGGRIFESGHNGAELRRKDTIFVIHAIVAYIGSSVINTKANTEFYIGSEGIFRRTT
jgi:hypothetical protein